MPSRRKSSPTKPPKPVPGPAALRAAYDRLLTLPNVQACFVGTKYRNGKSTGQTAIICCVSEKRPEAALAHEETVPPTIAWIDPIAGPSEFRTDVQQIAVPLTYQLGETVAGPGDYVQRANGEIATVGFALSHPLYGDVVTTAGHLFGGETDREEVTLFSAGQQFRAISVRVRINRTLDYALIRAETTIRCDNRFRDHFVLSNVYWPSPPGDLRTKLLILPREGQWRSVRCLGLLARVTLTNGRIVEDAILTDLRTTPGDSGCCVVGPGGLVWGLLVGRFDTDLRSYSVFVQAFSPLFEEGGSFIRGRLT